MGQKVNPNGLRLGINKDWEAKWYSNNKLYQQFHRRDNDNKMEALHAEVRLLSPYKPGDQP